MLHILYELGRAEHQFRFRFKGEYLRDGYTFEVSQQQLAQNSCFKLLAILINNNIVVVLWVFYLLQTQPVFRPEV